MSTNLLTMNGPIGEVIGKSYVVDIYRGSDSSNTEGISWWTTEYEEACLYASHWGEEGIVMHRTIGIPIVNGMLCNPDPYLLGGRNSTINNMKGMDLSRYCFGLSFSRPVFTDNVPHFNISIHESILNGLSSERIMKPA